MLVGQKLDEVVAVENVQHLSIKWHPAREFLGVSSHIPSTGGFVSFYTKKGGKPFYSSTVRPNQLPTFIDWHPLDTLLAVGWDSGRIELVDPTKRIENEIRGVDLGHVCRLIWADNGLLLLAADEAGEIRSFQFDKRHANDQDQQPQRLTSGTIVDETPTDICAKLLDRKVLELPNASEKMPLQKSSSFGLNRRKSESGNDGLSQLLSKHKKFMEFEEEKQLLNSKQKLHDNLAVFFLISTNKGGVYVFDPFNGQLQRVFQADSSIRQLLNVPEKSSYILAISEGMMFYELAVEGRLANDKVKVKLSGKHEHFSMIAIDYEIIAICYGEREIRVWDLENEDNAAFGLSTDKGYDSNEQIICLSYSSKKDTISGATSTGKVASWRRQRRGINDEILSIDQQFRLQNALTLNTQINEMAWSPSSTALAINSTHSVEIFLSQGIDFFVDTEYAVIQVSAQILTLIKITDPVETQELQLHTNIKGFFISGSHLLLWDDNKIQLDQIIYTNDSPLRIQTLSSFDSPLISKALYYNQQIYTVEKDRLLINTIQGTLKKSVTFREIEGSPSLLDVNGKWLCVATSNGYFRIYDLSDENLKLAFHSSHVVKSVPNFSQFTSVKVNSAGNRISFTILQPNDEVFEKLLIWDAESDSVGYFSFATGVTDQQEYDTAASRAAGGENRPKTAAERKIDMERSRYQMPLHIPGNHFWDDNDPRLLVCEANHIGSDNSSNRLLSMFVTTEHGIQMHDLQPRPPKADTLIAVSIPFIYFLKNIESDEEDDIAVERTISRLILRRTLREFVGIDYKNAEAVAAMLNFSFYLCVGQMDNAFKAIKFIKSDSVWEHMARMCVKTRRIDVARVCLGHMGNCRAACALRHIVEKGDSIDMQAARLALELGMTEEAITIYLTANRYDIVNKIYQAQGKWSEAFHISEKYDRIHLRNTHYNYAKYLESVGAIEAAIDNYEKASVHIFEVPRMLLDEPKALEFYIKRKGEADLVKWWAQYLESSNELDTAKNFYHSAGEYLSVVRIYCYGEQIQEACDVVDQTGDRAAAFHLARHLESLEDFPNAVKYFSKAGAFSSAIRLAKEHDMADKLANLALSSKEPGELMEVARYYEDLSGHADKAVMLYHKAGMIGRALDLAFKTEQFSALDLIAKDLDENSDPRVLERAAQFFSNNQQDHKAVQLLAYAKKYNEAVTLIARKNVMMTDELDNLLTPSKSDKSGISNVDRIKLLDEIARCCLQQGNYHFAAKKFTQAGNKLEAMRALLKSGDTAKIVLFANTARSKDIYKMAGNYLQTLNWKDDAELMRQVENFYLKANAMDLLASFYEACAQVEIDDYRDYEKGIAAYGEALRCLSRKNDEKESESRAAYYADRKDRLQEIVEKIKLFLAAKKLYDTDPGESLRQLTQMSQEENIDDVVRLGDIFSIMIIHNVKRSNYRKAWQIIEQCEQRRPKIDMRHYLTANILNQICDEIGVPRLGAQDNSDEEVDEGEKTIEYSHAMKRIVHDDNNDD